MPASTVQAPPETWSRTVGTLIGHSRENRLADGFVMAVEEVGNLLSTHFPAEPRDRNEIDDHVVEI